MDELITVLTVWPIPLSIELAVIAFFVWVGRDKIGK